VAQISITVPDGVLPRVRDAFAAVYGWTAELGITKAEFARRQIARYAKDVVRDYEASQAAETARQVARDAAETEVDVT
jgi:hypothetical protein